MFVAGELVVYGQHGVCYLDAVCPSPFDKQDQREYYVLRPALNTDHSTIYVPVEAAVGKLRPLMSAEDARDIMERFDRILPLAVPVEKMRRDLYRQTVAAALPDGYVAVLKAVAIRRLDALRAKRQLAGADSEYEQKARSYLALELSTVLGRSMQELVQWINDRVAEGLEEQ